MFNVNERFWKAFVRLDNLVTTEVMAIFGMKYKSSLDSAQVLDGGQI